MMFMIHIPRKQTNQMDNLIKIKNTNISTKGRHPEDILSNFCGNDFCFDDVQCGCMESFLQSLKVQDQQLQRKICLCKFYELESVPIPDWDCHQQLWWKGNQFDRFSAEYIDLLHRAYEAMYLWCARFRDALMSTVGKELSFNSEASDFDKVVITDKEFCEILAKLRDTHIEEYKKIIYPRMWPNSYGVDEDYES